MHAASEENGRFSENGGTHSVESPWTQQPCHEGPSLRCRGAAVQREALAAPWHQGLPSHLGTVLGPEKACQFRLLLQRVRQSGSVVHS